VTVFSTHEATDLCRDLECLLARVERSDLAVDVPPSGSTAIGFYVDFPGTPEWQPIAQSPAGEVAWNLLNRLGELDPATERQLVAAPQPR
jgi:hypothetical protein